MVAINNNDRRIWLASGSPRRFELLARLGFEPLVRTADVPEIHDPSESPEHYTARLAQEKGRAVRATLSDTAHPTWILAADTVVALGDDVMEKPVDREDGLRLIRLLSGKRHRVITSFWVGDIARSVDHTETVVTAVAFHSLHQDEIARYVASGEGDDKAGGYGIQGVGSCLVASIDGSYANVVGLPTSQVVRVLRRFGALREFPFEGVAL